VSLTVREYVKFIAPHLFGKRAKDIRCPLWPADVFAICCSILEHSGALRSYGTGFLCERHGSRASRIHVVKELAVKWRLSAGRQEPLAEIGKLWDDAIVSSRDLEIAGLGSIESRQPDERSKTCEALVMLCAIADEVFAGVGISSARAYPILDDDSPPSEEQRAEEDFWRICENLLRGLTSSDNSTVSLGATLCCELDPQRLRVLPKAQPPSNGLSTRSLTTYLSLCPTIDVPINWYQYFTVANDRKCNLLLVPWPFTVRPSQFIDCSVDANNSSVGWFGYVPDGDWHAPVNKVKELVAKAIQHVGSVDAVVLPETSVTREQYAELRSYLSAQRIPLIAGVCEPGNLQSDDELKRLGKNYAAISFPAEESWQPDTTFYQNKHHRWKINGSQIENYGIATQLDPQKNWWEGISLSDRSLSFFALRDWLCSCVLICEDLARLDPAGQFVRAVAPDLVVALLFDGPQIPTRWPAYHATVLADDPGCSVLTLSCLGMTQLSRPRTVAENSVASRTVGMWRDPRKGHVAIQIPTGKEAALLTITRCRASCETADGRSNSQVEGGPEFSGIYYL
jgi:hypothetical protein